MEERIEKLENEIIELKTKLKKTNDILSNIILKLNVVFKQIDEHKNFFFTEKLNFRGTLENLKKTIDNYSDYGK